jgi:uncharacterized protein YjbI with pentapeptide repeats
MPQPPDIIDLLPDQTYRNLTLDEQRHPRAELDGATFEACSLVRIDLRDARLNGAVFRDSDLTGARLAGAILFGATFERCKLMGIDFHDGLTLTAATFTGCNFDYTIFRGVTLDKMTFRQCTFVEADLSLASLRSASFRDCDLTSVDLTETAFFQTDLRGSTLGGWNLKRNDVGGIIVTTAQLYELALEIGILVDDGS